MIHPELHTQPVALDRQQHRLLRCRRDRDDTARMATLNSMFVAAGEFGEACKEYPLVWIEAGKDAAGARQVAPVAVFGLSKGENLCIEHGAWRTAYLPVALRLYPFALARAGNDPSGKDQYTVCYDSASPLFSVTEGEPLFDAAGEPTAFTQDVQRQLERVEVEVERTRQAGVALLRLDLLRERRFEATLPAGGSVAVQGFLTIDEERLAALPDAEVTQLHKNGLLAIVHAHLISLSNMRRLAHWHSQRHGAPAKA